MPSSPFEPRAYAFSTSGLLASKTSLMDSGWLVSGPKVLRRGWYKAQRACFNASIYVPLSQMRTYFQHPLVVLCSALPSSLGQQTRPTFSAPCYPEFRTSILFSSIPADCNTGARRRTSHGASCITEWLSLSRVLAVWARSQIASCVNALGTGLCGALWPVRCSSAASASGASIPPPLTSPRHRIDYWVIRKLSSDC